MGIISNAKHSYSHWDTDVNTFLCGNLQRSPASQASVFLKRAAITALLSLSYGNIARESAYFNAISEAVYGETRPTWIRPHEPRVLLSRARRKAPNTSKGRAFSHSAANRKDGLLTLIPQAASAGWAFWPPALRRAWRRVWSGARFSQAPEFLPPRARCCAWLR